ncbi:MAG: hypothetical protein AAGC74_13815, partial [Verrucomicrobiota bacterium]
MKVALIHYHLRTGGVTRVLENQSASLSAAGIDHLILSSTDFSTSGISPSVPAATIPALDYLSKTSLTPTNLYQDLLAACQRQFGSAPDLWHLHNHSLGKNILFPGLLKLLAESQTPLILQPHDFAEDNRPANYPLLADNTIYPLAPQIHYAFINNRDRQLLTKAGLPPQQTHPLPNPVQLRFPPESRPPAPQTHNLILYPIRGIRRKNLGEILLLAALAPADTTFAITLAPENPTWQPIHDRWQHLAEQLQLPILFNVADRIPPSPGLPSTYQSWRNAASHIITTSIAEGFGLAFLEPAALKKPLLGRDLPEIT